MQKLGNCLCQISSKHNVCVNSCRYFTVYWMKIDFNLCVTANLAWGGADFCESGKEYLNAETCKLYTFSVHNFETFCILCAFPSINIAKLLKLIYPVKLAEFRGWRIFMQIRQRIFKCFTMQICRLFFTAFGNFQCITRLSATNHHWVINAQIGPVFWPTLYYACRQIDYF